MIWEGFRGGFGQRVCGNGEGERSSGVLRWKKREENMRHCVCVK